jgi:hypothetical protein
MRLYGSKVPILAQEVVRALLAAKAIETEAPREVEADVASVLKSYLETDQKVSDKTRELLERTGRGAGEFGRVKQQVAESHGIKSGDDLLDWLLDQVVEMLMRSPHVEEVFAEDVELRRQMRPAFRKHLGDDDELDTEVRAQLKHVKEGTPQWDIEHRRVLDQVKRRRGLA